MDVSVDAGPAMVALGEVAAWSFDLEHWGECGQGVTEDAALANLARRTGATELRVVDRILAQDREQVFAADLRPATEDQVSATADILRRERERTIELVTRATTEQLEAVNADVVQPHWMRWRTADAIAWHIADTESRHYLQLIGAGERVPASELLRELEESGAWITERLRSMPRAAVERHGSEVWTSVKVLRRLAWHERVESVFLRRRLHAAGVVWSVSTPPPGSSSL